MTLCSHSITIVALIICTSLPASAQQYLLYKPQPAPSGIDTAAQDGILVQEIEIRKGDTLYDLSRKFSGRGMYFPQILLFNSIKNPNLIYAGDSLKVPLVQKTITDSNRTVTTPAKTPGKPVKVADKKASPKKGAHSTANKTTVSLPIPTPSTELSLSDLKKAGKKKNVASGHKEKTAGHAKKKQLVDTPANVTPSAKPPVAQKNFVESVARGETISGQTLFERAVKAYKRGDCRTALELFDRYLIDNSGSPLAADANLYKADCYLKLSAQ